MKILNFGSCNIDHVYTLDHIAEAGETLSVHNLATYPGGKGLNQSIAMARAGLKVYHAGYIGKNGEMLKDYLRQNNVCTSFVKDIEEANGHAVIQVSRAGENTIFVYHGSNERISKEYIDEVLSHFSEDDFIVLQNEINNVDYLIEKANQIKMKVFLNPSPYNDKMEKIDLNLCSYLIVNEEEAKKISGCDEMDEILKYFIRQYPELKLMLTVGKMGCIYQDKNCRIIQPIFKINVVDTTAAGDTFTGYFIAGIVGGKEYQEIIRIASCAAAVAVGKNGPVSSIPYMDEVLEQMEVLPEDNLSIRLEKTRDIIVKYIDNNIENPSLNELADNLGFSITHTGNMVRKIMGKTFREVVQEKRLRLAKEMLVGTDVPIEEIILKVGYENGNFFRKIFRKRYGENPLAYRKNHFRSR